MNIQKSKTFSVAEIEGQKIELLEREFLKQPQISCPVIHRFGPGVYIREVRVPAGTIAIGHHQNFEHMNVFLSGRVSIRNEDGTFTELRAPMTFVAKPGRKIGYVHEDMVWLNVYATDETDVEKLEAHFLTKSATWSETLALTESTKLLQSLSDQEDYKSVLEEFGFTEEIARKQSENERDQTKLPSGSYKIKVGKSSIEGKGLLATGDIEPGERIAPARIDEKRTIAGRFTNHSKNPNAKMVRAKDSDIDLVAISHISGCHGGLDGEEITINYREALKLTFEIGAKKCLP